MVLALARRDFLISAAALASLGACATKPEQEMAMYGLIGKFTATAGDRDRLSAILLKGLNNMPGCLSYIVANDPADANALWITEVWDSSESHMASLSLPSVKAAIQEGRPLIAGMDQIAETQPVGGYGLVAS